MSNDLNSTVIDSTVELSPVDTSALLAKGSAKEAKTAMRKLAALKAFLLEEGLIESEEDFEAYGNGGNSVEITVSIPLDEVELPEELKHFKLPSYEVERAVWKNNAEKRTWNGANFELALRGYASDLMSKDPENVALAERVEDIDSVVKLEEYKAARDAIWNRICNDPKIVAWEKELEEDYL